MVHDGPWQAAGWVPEERRKIFNKLQAASYKPQASWTAVNIKRKQRFDSQAASIKHQAPSFRHN